MVCEVGRKKKRDSTYRHFLGTDQGAEEEEEEEVGKLVFW